MNSEVRYSCNLHKCLAYFAGDGFTVPSTQNTTIIAPTPTTVGNPFLTAPQNNGAFGAPQSNGGAFGGQQMTPQMTMAGGGSDIFADDPFFK